MGNKFPNVDKPTDAFWDRLKLCKFPNRFVGTDQIPDLEKTWLDDPDERSGILNWMIAGSRRVLKNGFSMTKTQEETVIQFKRASDSIEAFMAECLTFDINSYVAKAEAQEYYKSYCEVIGVPNESDKAFSAKLRNCSKIKDTSIRIGLGRDRKKVKIWQGIKLKPLPKTEGDEDEEEDDPNDKAPLVQSTLGTDGTVGTDSGTNITGKISQSQKNKGDITPKSVPEVPVVPDENESEVHYVQFVCVFCQKAIMDSDWVQDDFCWNKPAHRKCYDEKKDQLADRESREDQ